MNKAKNVTQKQGVSGLFTSIILVLYLISGLSPKLVEIEYEGFQWLYFSILNLTGLGYIYFNREQLKPFVFTKRAIHFFGVFILFFLVSCISLIKAISTSEGVVHLLRLLNILAGTYVVFSLVKSNPKKYFELICKVCVVLLFYNTLLILGYYLGNFSKPRVNSLVTGFKSTYASINFFTASLILKLPFALYLFYKSKNEIWKFGSGFVSFLTMLSIFFGGSRTAILSFSVIVIIILIYLLYKALKDTSVRKNNLLYVIYFVVAPLISVAIFLNSNKINKNKINSFSVINGVSDDYKKSLLLIKKDPEILKSNIVLEKEELDLTTRLLNMSGRGNIWSSAVQMFKENPLLGVGYANFKVDPKPNYFKVQKRNTGTYTIPLRVHNDFLEKFAETGVLGGTLYILLFVIILLTILNLIKKKSEDSTIVFTLLLVAIAYTFDSFFNFPIERVPIVMFFVFMSAFLLAIYQNSQVEKKKLPFKSLHLALLFTIALSIVLNYMVFKVYSLNIMIKNEKEFKKRGYDLSYAGLENEFYSFPQLDQDAISVAYHKANVAIQEEKYATALKIIEENSSKDDCTQNILLDRAKAQVYLKASKNKDSATYYFKKGFKRFPSFKNNYLNLLNIYTDTKDFTKKENLLNRYTKLNNIDPEGWIKKAEFYNFRNGTNTYGLKVLDTGIANNPRNLKLLKAKLNLVKFKTIDTNSATPKKTKTPQNSKKYNEVIRLYNKSKFKEARILLRELLKEDENDYLVLQYLGIVEMNLRNYKRAIPYLTKSIESKKFKDGKAEFCRGFCYERTGNIKKSKEDYRSARMLNYPLALKLKPSKYK